MLLQPESIGSNASTENAGIEVEAFDGKQRLGNLLLYLQQEGEKEERASHRVCQSQKGNDLHPSDASASTAHAGVVR
jgi:hypothetical protein